MAVQSLYRKWRSQTFAELVGQEHVVQTLRNSIVEDRVAHAYLFTGPRGVGKTSMARLLAKAVNCTAEAAERPCGRCVMCQSVAEGRAVDVIEMDAASHTSVEDARELIERVQFRPTEGRYKVYIIDETHMLSTAAFNALLKTLEEPPDHAIFILATTEVHKVPETILSRCQRFSFTRHSISATAAHLRRIATEEGMQLEAGVAEMIARAATGSMRDALSTLEQIGSFTDGPVTLQQVQSLLGMSAAGEVATLIGALIANDARSALHAVNSIADQGADLRQFTRDLVERLRAVLLLRATSDRSMLDVSDDEMAELEAWAQQVEMGEVVRWVRLFSGLDHELRTSPYGHLPLEIAVVEALVAPTPAATAAPVVSESVRPGQARPAAARPPRPQASFTPPPAPAAATSLRETPAPSPPAETPANPAPVAEEPISSPTPTTPTPDETPAEPAPQPVEAKRVEREAILAANQDLNLLEQVEVIWPELLRELRILNKTLQALVRDVKPIDVEGNTVVLLASSPFHKTQVERVQNRQIVEEILTKHMGTTFGIRCTTEARSEQNSALHLRTQLREARRDPLVKAAMNIFDADVVDIEAADEANSA